MKMHILLILLIISMTTLFSTSCQRSTDFRVVLENNTTIDRVDEAVAITRSQLEAAMGEIPAGRYPVLTGLSGEIIPSQYDDLTGDGRWDEMFFLVSLDRQSQVSLKLGLADADDIPTFPARSNIRFARIQDGNEYIPLISARRFDANDGLTGGAFQMEGPAWENDLVGFRNYFDIRNGMDIFGKLTTDMVLDRVGIGENYHLLQDWGMDILKVGASLGSGAIALIKDGKLHRVAPGAEGSYELITQGPLRSMFRLRFDNWEVGGERLSLVHDISIWGGTWFYESRVFLEGFQGSAILVAGITSLDLDDKEAYREIFSGNVVAFGTHGEQAIEGEMLGMAVITDRNSYASYEHVGEEGEDIVESFLVKMHIENDKPVSFRFYSCWELSHPQFTDEDYFYSFLEREAKEKDNPIVVKLQ